MSSDNENDDLLTESEISSSNGDDEVLPLRQRIATDSPQQPSTSSAHQVPKKYTSKDGSTWSTQPSNSATTGRASKVNVIKKEGGPTNYIRLRYDNIVDIFLELFDRQNIDDIIKYTKIEAERQGDSAFVLDTDELHSFLGLCLARGVFKGKGKPIKSFWSNDYGRLQFKQTMARDRFLSIQKYLRFDDKSSRIRRRELDKFCAIRTVWDRCLSNFQKCYFPHGVVTVDEQLLSCKCRCAFIQYMSKNPGKFGIKFWLLCDSSTYYILQGSPCVGKTERPTKGLGKSVALSLLESYTGSGLHVTMDNYFMSQSLAV